MTETTEAAPPKTDATEAAATSLLTSTEVTATDQQQGEAQKTEAPKVEETAKPEGAPESYDFKAPEGKGYDPAVLDSFSAAAKQANLTQDAAQKLLESMAPALAERQQAQVKAVQDGWLDASRSDKEFGGDKLQSNLAVAKTALDKFASPELKSLLTTTGLGNNPEVIRMFYRAGKAISEDTFVSGSPSTDKSRDIGAILYDNTKRS